MMKVEEISVASCVPFSGNPFKVKDDFDMELLVQSVLDYGVMFPIMVRPLDGGKYEIVSGHRRVHACVKAGIDKRRMGILPLHGDSGGHCRSFRKTHSFST